MKTIRNDDGIFVELPKDQIKFESKEAEIIFDLSLENDFLEQENKKLKTLLKGTTHCYDEVEHKQLMKENKELKKQLEKKYEKVGTLTGELLYEENTKLINQQKEFIEWLEIRIKDRDKVRKMHELYSLSEERLSSQYFILQDVLSKYKEIIGGKNE